MALLRKTPREKALGLVDEMDTQGAKWATERDAALSDLAALELTLGEDALADPVAAAQLPARMTALRDRASIAGRAVEAAESRGLAARRDAVGCEADEMQPQVDAARAAVEEHERGTVKLLKALEDFSGQEYNPRTSDDARAQQEMLETGTITLPIPKVYALEDALARVEIARDLLRASAEGRDLRTSVPAAFKQLPWSGLSFRFVDLPASLHPTRGLLPAVEFVDPAEQADAGVRQVRAELADYQRKVDGFDVELVGLAAEVEAAQFVARRQELEALIGEVQKSRGLAMQDVDVRVEQLAAVEASRLVTSSVA